MKLLKRLIEAQDDFYYERFIHKNFFRLAFELWVIWTTLVPNLKCACNGERSFWLHAAIGVIIASLLVLFLPVVYYMFLNIIIIIVKEFLKVRKLLFKV